MNQKIFEKNYTMSSLHKAIKVLKAFSKDEPSLSLTELSKKTGISISSLQRFVSTFVYEGFLHKDERTKRYQLGHSLLYLGNLVKEESSLIIVAEPILKKLNEEIGESVSMNIIDGLERRCILNFDSTYPLSTKMFVGDTSPLYAGASSKILLAFMPNVEEYVENISLEPITDQTILSREQLLKELKHIRLQQFATSKSERVRGACSISAPILNASQQIIASVTLVIPEVRYSDYDENLLIDTIQSVALEIEKQLY
ncbi:IclR family transcriptional regulator [Lysinibacillus sphaericus]|uniref:IclR family transcriptional regulator n=1 Tax=Lysinibacillus sphaericus TaxID=1421 RepID=A0A544UCJ2_LYSSH|nr:IclR family transcriptional regulator [Lysinibacillus sp. SDF0037]TQR30066.1 IclR family transcriptional regulator [Lysinibacillus sp. SDF0037]